MQIHIYYVLQMVYKNRAPIVLSYSYIVLAILHVGTYNCIFAL